MLFSMKMLCLNLPDCMWCVLLLTGDGGGSVVVRLLNDFLKSLYALYEFINDFHVKWCFASGPMMAEL